MKNNNTFQYVIIGIFVFFIIVGAVLFSTYRSSQNSQDKITVELWGTIPDSLVNTAMVQFFGEYDLKYSVNYFQIPAENFDEELVEALASGTGPDAVILPHDLIYRYANRVFPIPYTLLPELNYKQTFVQEGEMLMTPEGILGLPLSIDPLVLYWNRDIFNNKSITKPPTLWSDLLNMSTKFVEKDLAGNLTKSLIGMGEYRNVNNSKAIISALFLQTGNPIVKYDATTGDFISTLRQSDDGSNPITLALQYYTNFANPNRPEYTWNRSMPSSQDVFTNGEMALYIGYASEFSKIKAKNPNLNFDVSLLPQAKGSLSMSTFGEMQFIAILKSTQNPSGVYEIISSLTSAEAYPFWQAQINIPSARRDILGQLETNSVKSIFNQSAVISKAWYDPRSFQTNLIFQEMVDGITAGRDSIDQSINTASDRINNLLK